MHEGALGTAILAEEFLLKDEVLMLLEGVACGESVKVDSKEASPIRSRPVSGVRQCFAVNDSGVTLGVCILLE